MNVHQKVNIGILWKSIRSLWVSQNLFETLWYESKNSWNNLGFFCTSVDPMTSRNMLCKMWAASAKKANRIAMTPLALPKSWTKVLRLTTGPKLRVEDLMEVKIYETFLLMFEICWKINFNDVACDGPCHMEEKYSKIKIWQNHYIWMENSYFWSRKLELLKEKKLWSLFDHIALAVCRFSFLWPLTYYLNSSQAYAFHIINTLS